MELYAEREEGRNLGQRLLGFQAKGIQAALTEKLDIAVAALQEICKEDGPGCDLSPAGPCHHIATEALRKIGTMDADQYEKHVAALTAEADQLRGRVQQLERALCLAHHFDGKAERFPLQEPCRLCGLPADDIVHSVSALRDQPSAVVKMDEINFNNLTREEAIGKIKKLEDPKLRPLIKWIAESLAFGRVAYDARVCIANAERDVEVVYR